MMKNIRFFLGTLSVHNGEYETYVRTLVVANTQAHAWPVLDRAAATFYGEEDDESEDGDYYTFGREIRTRAYQLHEISLGTFLELQGCLSTHRDDNIPKTLSADVLSPDGFKAFGASLAKALARKGVEVGQSVMLNVLSQAFGQKNWAVLKDKLTPMASAAPASPRAPDAGLSTPDAEQWVIFAASERDDFASGEALDSGYWDNEDGWSALERATVFTRDERESFSLPMSAGNDAQWVRLGQAGDVGRQAAEDASQKPGTWTVNVCRTAHGFASYTFEGVTREEAEARALDAAADEVFSDTSSQYEVTGSFEG